NTDKIFFGAFVSLEDDDGEPLDIRIVGHDEIDPQKRWISIDSPMAKALLGKEVDDEITVQTPSGEDFYTVTNIRYPQMSAS
ncbi:GreA/GreB family elongation factor, partial [Halomonas sp. 707D4]